MPSDQVRKKVDNVVYVLGAGFSAPLGIPVMSNFLEKSKDIFALEPDRYTAFANVFKTIDRMYKSKGYFNADLFNIEEILSILEMSEELDSTPERSLFANYIIAVIQHYTPQINFISRTYWHRNAFADDDLLNLYGYFVGSLLNVILSDNSNEERFCNPVSAESRIAQYSVISLNYDMVLENSFSSLLDNFNASSDHGFSTEIEDSPDEFSKRTHLAKLHGSIHTKTIVPPTWNKGLHETIRPAWRLAYRVLTQANHIRMIGYSLPAADAYVKYLLKAAIINCEHLKSIDVICLDPNGSVKKRYDQFICFPNYRFINSSVLRYLQLNYDACIENLLGSYGVLRMNFLEDTHREFTKQS